MRKLIVFLLLSFSAQVFASPIISFAEPSDLDVLQAGSDMPVRVEVEAENEEILFVQLKLDGVFWRTEYSAPYEWGGSKDKLLHNMQAGTYVVRASVLYKADNNKRYRANKSITVTVADVPDEPFVDSQEYIDQTTSSGLVDETKRNGTSFRAYGDSITKAALYLSQEGTPKDEVVLTLYHEKTPLAESIPNSGVGWVEFDISYTELVPGHRYTIAASRTGSKDTVNYHKVWIGPTSAINDEYTNGSYVYWTNRRFGIWHWKANFTVDLAFKLWYENTEPYVHLPAFPGAEGYGKYSVGGRGGSVLYVTNLNDSGPGSFREAIEAEGPRTVIFRVGGTINLRTALRIHNPYLTIAGETAPGDGIMLRGLRLVPDGEPDLGHTFAGALIWVYTHNVIVRHIRLRPGTPSSRKKYCAGIKIGFETVPTPVEDIIVDHVSISWATKDALDSYCPHANNITVQNSILSEGGLNNGHKGALVGGGASRYTFYQNLLSNNGRRNPWVKAARTDSTFQIVNNVLYNIGDGGIYVGDIRAGWEDTTYANVIGNFIKAGPSTKTEKYGVHVGLPRISKVYAHGNLSWHMQDDEADNWDIMGARCTGCTLNSPASTLSRLLERISLPEIPTLSAREAFEYVLDNVGATKPKRDVIDNRLIREARSGTEFFGTQGRIINYPGQVGGFPVMMSGTPYTDTDQDGIEDSWEHNIIGTIGNDDSSADHDNDGYTNLEEFLHYIGNVERMLPSEDL